MYFLHIAFLYTILRVFVLDSMAFKNIDNLIRTGNPDVLEILPGVMPKIIKKVCKMLPIPIIAGGLISEREDVLEALDAGAISVSSTNPDVKSGSAKYHRQRRYI